MQQWRHADTNTYHHYTFNLNIGSHNMPIIRLATSKSTGRYITCIHCHKEEYIYNPDAMAIDSRDYTCSKQCNEQYFILLGQQLDEHDEYCDLCNPNLTERD